MGEKTDKRTGPKPVPTQPELGNVVDRGDVSAMRRADEVVVSFTDGEAAVNATKKAKAKGSASFFTSHAFRCILLGKAGAGDPESEVRFKPDQTVWRTFASALRSNDVVSMGCYGPTGADNEAGSPYLVATVTRGEKTMAFILCLEPCS